ncbi:MULTISPECIES: DUF5667 domain-containing protein [Streptomyces]|uniref:DUF5667 domain-containing protein n=1 Tax=Streptomyces TaxID=1883 RepID=UPI00017F214D|nr:MULTISPECIES: DUF5667 domain-containing protein [Streptomyces]AKL67277.1 hypothetical protein M444_19925 [Streptomyces sp. Mg1]RPK47575.1 hypothetical protein EES37_10535 [Streptomyces sp. ADI91-18]WBY21441.1 DUF5667 domain-containing protein [Streptomyces goshikiensis]WSS00217.1 DUF5667 domain-containing protein [Streptomyces goshikiensis]WSX98722.1 DUF5667 domain-containing protein [Streptomyces goshikiensis]
MIANVTPHRRANAFAQALEDRNPSDPSEPDPAAEQSEAPAEPADHNRLLALASVLGERMPRPELDPEVKVVQRAQLVAAMEAMVMEERAGGGAAPDPLVPEQRTGRGAHRATSLRKLRPRSRWSKGIAAGGLTVGVAAGAFSGVAAASTDALPGDSLYPVKRGMEDLKLGMADDDSDRGELYLDQASHRLSEARRLMERGRTGVLDHESLGEIRRALAGMRHDASEGHRLLQAAYERDGSLGPIQTLSSFSRSHRDAWGRLREKLPPQLGDVGGEVESVFKAIDEDVAPLQGMLPKPPEQPRGGTGATSAKPSAPAGKQQPAASPGTPSAGGHPASPAAPSGSTTSKPPASGGLLGGTGDLLNPPGGHSPVPSAATPELPKPDITLPPLLPGLLPGLGLSAEDAAE